MLRRKHTSGFTLIEMVIVMVILAIVSSTILIFMQRTFSGYEKGRERMLLVDRSRGALNQIKRELRLALPNSIRVANSAGVSYLEFVPVVVGGRYRVGGANGGDSSPTCPLDVINAADNGQLSIGLADTCLKTIGPVDTSGISNSNWMVVFNSGEGYAGSNFYESGAVSGGNKSKITANAALTGESRIAFESNIFAFDSPGHRFYVTKSPTTIVCDPTLGQLIMREGYTMQTLQPTIGLSSLGGTSSVISRNVTSCSITYSPSSIGGQYGVVVIRVSLGVGGDVIPLEIQTQVSNMP